MLMHFGNISTTMGKNPLKLGTYIKKVSEYNNAYKFAHHLVPI